MDEGQPSSRPQSAKTGKSDEFIANFCSEFFHVVLLMFFLMC